MSESEERSSLMPILVALAVTALAVIAFLLIRVLRGDEIKAESQIGRAVVGQNDALQREDYPDFVSFTCAAEQGSEPAVIGAHRQSTQTRGARLVQDVTGIAVSDDRATATVVYSFERNPEEKIAVPMSFVRDGGGWKVCSPGPG